MLKTRHLRTFLVMGCCVALGISSCESKSPQGSVCDHHLCPEHGHCQETDGVAECVCNVGYHPEGDLCIADPVCGNGGIEGAEECDDGNLVDGDGCSADCTAESICGDAVVEGPEECDDGNLVDGDGCSADCTAESICGDAVVEGPEECDDGGDSATCDADCTTASCGDGHTNTAAAETCDDGGDSASCDIDCTAAGCGDGYVNPVAGEVCDDGNAQPWDGCDATCQCAEWQVNTYAQLHQQNTKLASAADGSFVVIFQSQGCDGDGYGICGQRFDNDGLSLGTEFGINTYVTGDQKAPRIAMAASGLFVAVWRSPGQDGSGMGIFGQRYDATGAPVGTEMLLNQNTAGNQDEPGVAIAPDGHFVVVHTGPDSDNLGIEGRIFDANGMALTNSFQVNGTQIGLQSTPRVAIADDGTFVVVWLSEQQDGDAGGIYGRLFDASGNPTGAEFLVNELTAGDQRRPGLARAGSGGFLVAWVSNGHSGGTHWDVFGRRYDSAGLPLGGGIQINPVGSHFSPSSDVPSVTMAPDESAAVAWTTDGDDGSGRGVVYRRFDSTGAIMGPIVDLNSYTTGDQYGPFMALRPDGSVQ